MDHPPVPATGRRCPCLGQPATRPARRTGLSDVGRRRPPGRSPAAGADPAGARCGSHPRWDGRRNCGCTAWMRWCWRSWRSRPGLSARSVCTCPASRSPPVAGARRRYTPSPRGTAPYRNWVVRTSATTPDSRGPLRWTGCQGPQAVAGRGTGTEAVAAGHVGVRVLAGSTGDVLVRQVMLARFGGQRPGVTSPAAAPSRSWVLITRRHRRFVPDMVSDVAARSLWVAASPRPTAVPT
jgi:hypothetical protein